MTLLQKRTEEIRQFWISFDSLIKHREGNQLIEKAVKSRIKSDTKKVELLKAIGNYVTVLTDKSYYYDHHWTLDAFIKQDNGYLAFLDEGKIWEDYKAKQKPKDDAPNNKKNSFHNFNKRRSYSNDELEKKLGIRK